MTDTAEHIDGDYSRAAEWLARAARELEEICRSIDGACVGATSSRAVARLVMDCDEIREHARSLRRRLALVTRDPRLEVRLQAELSQLEWATRTCLRQLRLAIRDAGSTAPEVRAS
jgi:hypothetical protein